MNKSRKILKLEGETPDHCCDIPIYKCMSHSMMMLQGWFNDQDKCFELFIEDLTSEEKATTFDSKDTLDAVSSKYRLLWQNGQFKQVAKRDHGVHKLSTQLSYSGRKNNGFRYWASSVLDAVQEVGSLEELLESLDSVEDAHDKFKPWFYKTEKVRNLNAADAARILAAYDCVIPERRPLLSRGSLRGAAILLDDGNPHKTINDFEVEYDTEAKRASLEKKAAQYIGDKEKFSRLGKWKMQEGESWFCNVIHKERDPVPRQYR